MNDDSTKVRLELEALIHGPNRSDDSIIILKITVLAERLDASQVSREEVRIGGRIDDRELVAWTFTLCKILRDPIEISVESIKRIETIKTM